MERAAREYITSVLTVAGGDVPQAAQMAGLSRQHFYRLIERHNIERNRALQFSRPVQFESTVVNRPPA